MSISQRFSECIFHGRGKCDAFWGKKGNIHQELVNLSMLDESIHQHSLEYHELYISKYVIVYR
jgi:hypothetical protein